MALAGAVNFENVRLWAAPDHTRVVFDTSAAVTPKKVFVLQNPDRLVIDVPAAQAASVLTSTKAAGLVTGVRAARNDQNTLRIVLELKQTAEPRTFTLKPNEKYGHRLVVDLYGARTTAGVSKKKVVKKSVAEKPAALRDLVIAIDAGHGGEDPGARGSRGTKEKTVVLAIARQLAELVRKEPGMRPVLIREGDYYIGLRQRINKARKHNADLFISIHADAFRDKRAHGSSVFVLSRRGASSEMGRWLANQENAADLAGGVSLDDKDDLLAEVLLDLSQSATIEASHEVAANMLGGLKRLGKTHKSTVQRAGFVVLKSPDIPSILVETAFISNPQEESKLRDKRHQKKLAKAMLTGIRDYFGNNPPPGTRMVARKYKVKRGDTLSEIAAVHRVSLASLRGYNSLKSDRLRVGETLRIPPTRGS
ncbi:MAG: N-acetylmuramoyl-L-alanine amidase [Gammaproteobacteria bacterium]|nr:N-acetylmuramoyl-L-alanine amidase [Gammaproteobacteria bacterium]